MENKIALFKNELELIKSPILQEFVVKCLESAPDYFWTVPSSSTGKYHPAQSNGNGGLVRHTRAAVYFANKLCDVYLVEAEQKDLVIAATILHDITKYGIPKQKYTTKIHGYEAALFIEEVALQNQPMISQKSLDTIKYAVKYHFGRWTTLPVGHTTKHFPEDYGYIERIVHLADVVSAQKEVSLGFLEADQEKNKVPCGEITMPFGKHRSKALSEIPTDYLRWMSMNMDDKILSDGAVEEMDKRNAARAARAANTPKEVKPQVFVDTDDIPF